MNHLIVLPIVLPAILAPFIIMAIRHHLDLQRIFSLGGTGALIAITLALMTQATTGDIAIYELGNWPAPFGIVLVLDRLSALMILLTALLAMAVLLYVIGTGWDTRGRHFHALFQFQLMGVMGAFLTGDAFNLFVFFEVLLIASYGLMIHGGGARRLRAGVQYVVYNLLGSTLFLFALGTLYAVTGTLNMADLAERVAALPADDTALLRVGAVLLLLVFAIKAAVLPLHFWLPNAYAYAPSSVTVFLASTATKVALYLLMRLLFSVFGIDVVVDKLALTDILIILSLAAMFGASIVAIFQHDVKRLFAYSSVAQIGYITLGIALANQAGLTGSLVHMFNHAIMKGALFLAVGAVVYRIGSAEIDDFSGLGKKMPITMACLLVGG